MAGRGGVSRRCVGLSTCDGDALIEVLCRDGMAVVSLFNGMRAAVYRRGDNLDGAAVFLPSCEPVFETRIDEEVSR